MNNLTLTNLLRQGLRKQPNSRDGAVQFNNLEPSINGAQEYRAITNCLPESVLRAFNIVVIPPFPQVYRGKAYTFLLTQDRIFTIHDDNLFPITTYDIEAPANTKDIVAGKVWQVADAGESLFFFNGSCTVVLPNFNRLRGEDEKVLVSSLMVNTGIYHRGRFIFGGFNNSIGTWWKDFWKSIANVRSIDIDFDVDLKPNQIVWSTIGGDDATFLFDTNRAVSGELTTADGLSEVAYGSSRPFILDILKRNDCGSTILPSQGSVQAIKSLGDAFLVYTNNGVHAFIHSYNPVDNTPAYKQIDLLTVGIEYGGCAASNDKVNLFIGTDNVLRIVKQDLSVGIIGLEEFLSVYSGTERIISYDDTYNRFIIGCADKSFIVNFDEETGVPVVSTTNQLVTSVFTGKSYTAHQSVPVGMCVPKGYYDSSGCIESSEHTFIPGGRKRVSGVLISGDYRYDSYVTVKTKYSNTDTDFVESSNFLMNNFGYAQPMVEGIQMRVLLYLTDVLHTVINSLIVLWEKVGGVY